MNERHGPSPHADGVRECQTGQGCLAAGRPLIVEGAARVAPIELRGDWLVKPEVPSTRTAPASAFAIPADFKTFDPATVAPMLPKRSSW